ncbi:UPF0183 protein [Pelomyxa schiedti]|nr:UPF0183 protein [Pelomyxa schiedti]
MLELELTPGVSAGPFKIGASFKEVSAIVESSRLMTSVCVKYNDKEPLSQDILMDLTDNGILLRFTPDTQRLKTVEIYKVHKVMLKYGVLFCEDASVALGRTDGTQVFPPKFVHIYEHVGLTYSGDYSSDFSKYTLYYPGLYFIFDIPPEYRHLLTKHAPDEHPCEFPDRFSPSASRISLFYGTPSSPTLPPLPPDSHYFEQVIVQITKGLWFQKRNCVIPFFASVQDVLSDLGAPSEIFYKEEDKMKIHSPMQYNSDLQPSGPSATPSSSPNAQSQPTTSSTSASNPSLASSNVSSSGGAGGVYKGATHRSGCGDYFYNYYDYGFDILFDWQAHTVRKFVLHCNFPNHYEFNRYTKCNFAIQVPTPEQQRLDKLVADLQQLMITQQQQQLQLQQQYMQMMQSATSQQQQQQLIQQFTQQQQSMIQQQQQQQTTLQQQITQQKQTLLQRQAQTHTTDTAPPNSTSQTPTTTQTEAVQQEAPSQATVQTDNKETPQGTQTNASSSNAAPEPTDQDEPAYSYTTITPDTKWDQVSQIFGPCGKPVVNNRGSTENPFGPTFFHGYKNIIFEVLPNGHLASVCLFTD